MRIIQYDVTLHGDYTISSNYNLHANKSRGYTLERIQRPGIHMIIEHCDDLDKLCAAFRYDRVDGIYPKFERQIPQILCGNEPTWKLDCVRFGGGNLRLNFINETLYEKYLTRCEAHAYPYEFFTETAILDSYESVWHEIATELRFEVDNPSDGSMSVILISFGSREPIRITEFDGNKKRYFDFQHNLSFTEDIYRVTEWMQ